MSEKLKNLNRFQRLLHGRNDLRPNRSTLCIRVELYTISRYSDLLQFYLDLNTGGTPHSKEEIERVKDILRSVS